MTNSKTTDTEGSLVAVLASLAEKVGNIDGKFDLGMEKVAQSILATENRRIEDRAETHVRLDALDTRVTTLENNSIRKDADAARSVRRWGVRRDIATGLGAAVTAATAFCGVLAKLTGHWPL